MSNVIEGMEQTAVDIRSVSKVFGIGADRFAALDQISVAIRQNEFFTLLGPSGCGKTTLLRIIAGFDHPSEGEIWLDGVNISALPPFKRPINTVFQNYALFPHMTVAENIGFGLEMLRKPKDEIRATVGEMLRLVRMEELATRRVSQISGGQQQRVALARALAPRPKVLLLDEPLSALDLKLRKEMQIELKRLQGETGITFIFVTHDQEEALTMSDRIAVMSRGKMLQIGTPREIYDHPNDRFVANFIGDTNFLPAEIVTLDGDCAKIKLASGAIVNAGLPEDARPSGAVTIVVRPEQAELVSGESRADLTGRIENIVYFGTDTHYHLKIQDGSAFVVRQQSRAGRADSWKLGQACGVAFCDGAAQVLRS